METHELTPARPVEGPGPRVLYQARCSCRYKTARYRSAQAADQAARQHRDDKLKAALTRGAGVYGCQVAG